jgi:hypothetical protein
LWQALNALAQTFEACYAAFAREISDPIPRNKWVALLRELMARRSCHFARDAKLRLYRSERWSPAKWTALYAPFSRACSLRIEREPVRLDVMGAPTTIERQFLMLLLLKLADPGNLSPKDLEWVAAQLDEWCQPLRLTLKPATTNSFYVDLTGSTGFQRRALDPLEGRVLFCDLRPLLALMQQNRVALEEAVRNEPAHRQEVEASQRARALSSSSQAVSIPSSSRSPGTVSASRRAARSTPSSVSPTSARSSARTWRGRKPSIRAPAAISERRWSSRCSGARASSRSCSASSQRDASRRSPRRADRGRSGTSALRASACSRR